MRTIGPMTHCSLLQYAHLDEDVVVPTNDEYDERIVMFRVVVKVHVSLGWISGAGLGRGEPGHDCRPLKSFWLGMLPLGCQCFGIQFWWKQTSPSFAVVV
jgi:hypothetical protein